MTIALKIAGVALALVLLSGTAALAQDDTNQDKPATHEESGGDEPKDPPRTHGGPIASDDTPIDKPEDKPQTDEPRDPPAEEDKDEGPQGDPTPDTPPTTHPIDPGSDDTPANDPTPEEEGGTDGDETPGAGGDGPLADTVPTGEASCTFFDGWEYQGEPLSGAMLANTGNTVIKAGSIVYFSLGGQQVAMIVPFDVVPGGTWWYVIGNYQYQPLVFPAGTQLPPSGDCDIAIAFA